MGRGRLSLVAVGFAVAVALLVAAGAAQAKLGRAGRFEVQRANASAYMSLGKERGYHMALYMPNNRVVVLAAFRPERPQNGSIGAAYSIYAVHNTRRLRDGVVRARFGSLGRVSLRFRPGGQVEEEGPQRGCEGGSEITEYGRFVGHVAFRGEGNYFHLSTAKGAAVITHSPRLRCKKGRAQDFGSTILRRYVAAPPFFPDQYSIALLYASSHRHGRYVGITAVHEEGSPPGANLQLQIIEARHGMAIGRGAYFEEPRGTLLTSLPGAHPATATLAPVGPFYGEGAYSEEAQSWTGTLGVNLAGQRLPLTGPGFRVHLCVVNPVKDKDGCDFFKTEPPSDERPARPARLARPAWVLR